MQLEDRPSLELDESEFFDDEPEDMSPAGGAPPAALHSSPLAVGAADALLAGEYESDDDGIVLESECSSSDAEDDLDLVNRLHSLRSSLEDGVPVQEHGGEALGTSHNSQVGSLKTFGGVSFKGKRLFGSESDLAASMPVRSTAPMGMMMAGSRKVAPVSAEPSCNLGTSMPISIPMLQRRNSSADLLDALQAANGGRAVTFVPPHMVQRQEPTDLNGLISAPGGDLGLSPVAAAKREKLLARNAILRSTGFIEVQHPSTFGQVMDPVKDQLLGIAPVSGGTRSITMPGMEPGARAAPRSSLTRLLGTSKSSTTGKMPKRSAADAHLTAVVPGPVKVEGAIKSRSGRTVKPKVWDDGTTAAPLTALKDDAGEPSPSGGGGGGRGGGAHSSEADPDFSLYAEQQQAMSDSQGRGSGAAAARGGSAAQHHLRESDEEEAYSDGSPRVSLEGSQNGASLGRARSSSVGRDDHGKFVSGPRPRGSRGGGGSRGGRGEGGGIFKMAAVEVLRLEKRLMSTGEIARAALKRGLIKCTGKTPEATMASALYTDIKRKEGQSIFIRPHEGLFGLREWIEQGVAFQDEFAEEMAKRARVAYSAFVGMPGLPMMPGMVDSEGQPLSAPYPAMMPYHGKGPLGLPISLTSPTAAAAAKAAAEDSPDGLMELLCAAEELHKSASEGAEARDVKYAADGTAVPSSPSALGTAQAHPADTNLETAALAAVAADHMAGAQSPVSIAPAASAQGAQAAAASGSHSHSHSHNHSVAAVAGAAAAADTSAEESDAAAVLAAVAEAAGEAPSSAHSPSGGEAAALAALQHFPGFALADGATAAGGVPYSGVQPPQQQYGYAPCGFYPPAAYLYPPAPGLPPLPKQQRKGGTGSAATFAEADMVAAAAVAEMAAAGSSGSVDLMVRGSNRPFAALAAAAHGGGASAAAAVAAAMEAEGQEQVNILNLPLPEVELQSSRLNAPGAPSPAELDPAHLKVAEVQVMRLEKELGTSHPEVGKAYLSLSRLYLAGCEESSSKQLAVAALSRSWEILSVCQLALKKQPSCTSSFTYLMDKIRSAETHRPAAAAATATPAAAASAGGPHSGDVDAAAALGAADGPLAEQRPGGAPAATGEAAHVAYSPPILAGPRTTAAH
ncbi:hypothetical protein D9Q98_007809 [Chlorella vulgaris]|uniref:HTH HARE-type domain-containing protein n=1 Tax=Chlorella vulgaris TaxID=3077 RepID=A0A9D4YTR4_CHLVU|nr:hypothetical protein D9Q98_007809 [Chlorella vulgaris]